MLEALLAALLVLAVLIARKYRAIRAPTYDAAPDMRKGRFRGFKSFSMRGGLPPHLAILALFGVAAPIVLDGASRDGVWSPVQYARGAYTYEVRLSGGTAYAARYDGLALTSGADHGAVIQAAIDAVAATGGKVFVHAGTYTINTTLTIAASGTVLEGEGYKTVLIAKNALDADVLTLSGLGVKHCEVRELAINGNKTQQASGRCLYISTDYSGGDAHHRFENLWLTYGKDAAFTIGGDTRECHLKNVIADQSDGYGFRIVGSDHKILSCVAGANKLHGFYCTAGNTQYAGCKAFGNGTASNPSINNNYYGFYIDAARQQFTNCQAQDNYLHGFVVYHGASRDMYVSLIDCQGESNGHVNTAGWSGIRLDADKCIIIGGTATDRYTPNYQSYGLTIANAARQNVIVGVNVNGNKTAGISAGTDELLANTIIGVDGYGVPTNAPLSYLVSTDGTNVIARANFLGGTQYEGTDAGAVLNSAITALGSSGGVIFLHAGTYNVSTTILLNQSGVHLVGEGFNTRLLAANALNADIVKGTGATVRFVTVSNLRISGNSANQTSGRGLVFDHAATAPDNFHTVRDVWVDDCKSDGVYLTSDANNITLDNVRSTSNGGSGILASGRGAHVLRGCLAKSNQSHGIRVTASDCTLNGGTVQDNGYSGSTVYGLIIEGARCTVTGVVAKANRNHGFVMYQTGATDLNATITGCIAINNGQAGTVSFQNGIRLDANGCTVTGCRAYDDQGTPTQQYGIDVSSARSNNVVVANNVVGNAVAGIVAVDPAFANNMIGRNLGWLSQNRGVAQILNGQTSIVVTHGLARQPTAVVLAGEHAEASAAIITAKGATTFTITVPAAVTANRNVDWYAEV